MGDLRRIPLDVLFNFHNNMIKYEIFRYIYEQERLPDMWFRKRHLKLYEESLTAAAEFLGAKTENLALIDNVTTGEKHLPSQIDLCYIILHSLKISYVMI